MYIYATEDEIENRIKALCKEDDLHGELDRKIVATLMHMLDDINPLVKKFRQARDRIKEFPDEHVATRILAPQNSGDVQYNLSTR